MAASGAVAQEAARQVERTRKNHGDTAADALLEERKAAEGSPISSTYAAKQAKALVTQLYAKAGGVKNATAVMDKVVRLPEIRVLDIVMDAKTTLSERCIQNVVDLLGDKLATSGTRHAADQNLHDGILTALVDPQMEEDKLINPIAKLFGVSWHAVKRAVERRLKIDAEETERRVDAVWTQRKRSERFDKFKLPGFYKFCHHEDFFKFSSRHSAPLREHTDVGVYTVSASDRLPLNPLHPQTMPLSLSLSSHVFAATSYLSTIGRVRSPSR
jgi:hypothetical protein